MFEPIHDNLTMLDNYLKKKTDKINIEMTK